DALRRGDALVDERLRQRAALLRAAADERELVGRNELGRRQQVDDELGELVHAVRRRGPRGSGRLVSGGAERGRLVTLIAHAASNPSNEVSASASRLIRPESGPFVADATCGKRSGSRAGAASRRRAPRSTR